MEKALGIVLGGQHCSLRSDTNHDREMESKLAKFKALFWEKFLRHAAQELGKLNDNKVSNIIQNYVTNYAGKIKSTTVPSMAKAMESDVATMAEEDEDAEQDNIAGSAAATGEDAIIMWVGL